MHRDHNSPGGYLSDSMDKSISDTDSVNNYDEAITIEGKKSHRCSYPDCGKIFRFKSEISRHLVVHLPKRPFQCSYEECKKTFKRIDALENHIRIHEKTKCFTCDHPGCDDKFTSKAGLRYHHLKHTDERSFKCSIPGCDKAFFTISHLKQHEKSSQFHKKISKAKETEAEKSVCSEPYHPILKIEEVSEGHRSQPVRREDFINSYGEQDLQNLLNKVLQENQLLVDRLDLCRRMMNSAPVKKEMKEVKAEEPDDGPNCSYTFFGQSSAESTFLDYINGRNKQNF